MTTLTPLKTAVSACGNILRGSIEVNGKEYRLEANLEVTWLHIIDENSRCETCVIESGCIVSDGGECVTDDWSAADWSAVEDLLKS